MDALRDILASEDKIDESIEKAKIEAEKLITNTEISSRNLIEKKKEELGEKLKVKTGKLKKNLEEKRNKKIEGAKKEAVKIKKKAQNASKKAVDFIYDEFLKEMR